MRRVARRLACAREPLSQQLFNPRRCMAICEAMLQAFLPASATRIVLYLQPINPRWGTAKLRALCRDVLCIEPDLSTCFLFVNPARDTLLLYFLDIDGEQTLMKRLDKGAFLLPAPEADGAPFVVLRPSMLPRLFRT